MPSGRRFNWGSRGFTWVRRRGYSGSPWFTRARPVVVGFIRVRIVLRVSAIGWSGSFGFVWVNLAPPRRRRVHSGSCGSTWAELGVVGFIRFRIGSLVRA